jgi:hypothetical protein
MKNIDRYFIGTGIALGFIGMAMGIEMGMRHDVTFVPVHTHLNLVGWVTLVLFGLCYRSGAARKDNWAAVHFVVAVAGAVIFPIGIYRSIASQGMAFVIIGSLLTLVSMLLFAVNFARGGR